MSIMQEKMVPGGQVKRWIIDEATIKRIISWTARRSSLLEQELTEMDEHFPYFFLTLASRERLVSGRVFCPQCGDLITFEEGIRCVACNTTFTPYRDSILGFVGQIPSYIGLMRGGDLGERGTSVRGRPFLQKIHQRLQGMQPGREREKLRQYFLAVDGDNEAKIYFSPRIYAFYPSNWPRKSPEIMVSREYFDKVLFVGSGRGCTDFHAYSNSGNLLRLCNYSSWHSVTMRVALQQRIVPKIIIDLMIADLLAVQRLDTVTSRLGTSVHNLYNWIGKRGRSERFKREYERYVHID